MLAVGHNASNGRFREAVAAFTKDRSWPIFPFPERLLLSQAVVTRDRYPFSI